MVSFKFQGNDGQIRLYLAFRLEIGTNVNVVVRLAGCHTALQQEPTGKTIVSGGTTERSCSQEEHQTGHSRICDSMPPKTSQGCKRRENSIFLALPLPYSLVKSHALETVSVTFGHLLGGNLNSVKLLHVWGT